VVVTDPCRPLISVLVPNFNYAQYVGVAVDSALAQTYPNFEVIVSDNCSTDGAWELLCERYGHNPRVRLYQNEQNIGMARNFDRLLELARGRYVMCLSSDDFLLPPHLARLEEVFAREPDLDVVYCNAYFAREDGTVYATRAMPGEFPASYVDARDELVENFTSVCPVCFPCALFKRDVLREPGMCGDPLNGQGARDWELIILLALANKRFGYVAGPSMAIRLHADQFSGHEYHRSGRNVLDFASYVERYVDHPEFVRRMRGRETGVARFLHALVGDGALRNDGRSPFDDAELARFAALEQRLHARAAVYEPARVRESKISVVVESAGAPRQLLGALDSLMAQRFDDWEAVVVDHGGIPCEPLLRAHPAWDRLSYVRLPVPQTPGAARNLALRMIRGEYVAFLDPDNRFAPDHLSRAVETIARSGASVTFAASRLTIERSDAVASQTEPVGEAGPFGGSESDRARLEIAHAIPLDALVVYRGQLDPVDPFNAAVPALDDWDFALRLMRSARFAPTGAATIDVVMRLGLATQRLAATVGNYLVVLDALYAAHPVDAQKTAERARHRATVAGALASAKDWVREPHGLIAFMDALAGRQPASALRTAQPA
jgi:glycosyltransferase involved in cell wall biosynthesis